MESIHSHTVSRATMEESMEDAAYHAYLYYRGCRFEAMKEDGFRFFPRYDPTEETWVINHPEGLSPTLEAQVRLTYEQQMKIGALEEEFRRQRNFNKQARVVIDDYIAQLNIPWIHEKIDVTLVATDTAPQGYEVPCNRSVISIVSRV